MLLVNKRVFIIKYLVMHLYFFIDISFITYSDRNFQIFTFNILHFFSCRKSFFLLYPYTLIPCQNYFVAIIYYFQQKIQHLHANCPGNLSIAYLWLPMDIIGTPGIFLILFFKSLSQVATIYTLSYTPINFYFFLITLLV